MVTFKDRITELRRVPAVELRENPRNWRHHPQHQREGLETMLGRIGYADAVIARETPDGLVLIDGHLRVSTTPEAVVRVLVVDLSEAEADEVLATLDPLAALAQPDAGLLKELIEGIDADNSLQVLLQDISDTYNVGLTELLEQDTQADYVPLPETYSGEPVERGGQINNKTSKEGNNLKPFMFYIEQERYNELTEAVFALGEAWEIDTVADVVYEAIKYCVSITTGEDNATTS